MESAIPNQIIEAIISGVAPEVVKLAAARGLLPFSNEEKLEALVALTNDGDDSVRSMAATTLQKLDPSSFIGLASERNTPPSVLGFFCLWPQAPRELVEAALFNTATPDTALVQLASMTRRPAIIEAISFKQQSLIRSPAIIEAVLANPARTPEAERRVREVKEEFFDKQFGAQMVAQQERVRAEAEAEERDTVKVGGLEDLIRLGLVEEGIDDSFVIEYEQEFGPFDDCPPHPEECFDVEQVVTELAAEQSEISLDRMPVFFQVAMMSVKERVMLAIKGTREARMILIRDPNRMVATAVLRNPRLSDTEVESISSMKCVPEDVLRQIGQNRAWTRAYPVIHNLIRNSRTPIATSLSFINRIQSRDMRALSLNKNIPDVIRSTAYRLFAKRTSSNG
ncbi:MAG: HEAT repeat domain-containing protein [Blastocatellia bacterium]